MQNGYLIARHTVSAKLDSQDAVHMQRFALLHFRILCSDLLSR